MSLDVKEMKLTPQLHSLYIAQEKEEQQSNVDMNLLVLPTDFI